jgi:hypothetical protein
MPVNDNQFEAAAKWFLPNTDFRARIDFIWDGLTGPQQSALIDRIKTDLNADIDKKEARLDEQRADINSV